MSKILEVRTGQVRLVDGEGFIHIDIDREHSTSIIHRQHCSFQPILKGDRVRVIETDVSWHIEKDEVNDDRSIEVER